MNLQHNVQETESGMRIDQLLSSFDEIISPIHHLSDAVVTADNVIVANP